MASSHSSEWFTDEAKKEVLDAISSLLVIRSDKLMRSNKSKKTKTDDREQDAVPFTSGKFRIVCKYSPCDIKHVMEKRGGRYRSHHVLGERVEVMVTPIEDYYKRRDAALRKSAQQKVPRKAVSRRKPKVTTESEKSDYFDQSTASTEAAKNKRPRNASIKSKSSKVNPAKDAKQTTCDSFLKQSIHASAGRVLSTTSSSRTQPTDDVTPHDCVIVSEITHKDTAPTRRSSRAAKLDTFAFKNDKSMLKLSDSEESSHPSDTLSTVSSVSAVSQTAGLRKTKRTNHARSLVHKRDFSDCDSDFEDLLKKKKKRRRKERVAREDSPTTPEIVAKLDNVTSAASVPPKEEPCGKDRETTKTPSDSDLPDISTVKMETKPSDDLMQTTKAWSDDVGVRIKTEPTDLPLPRIKRERSILPVYDDVIEIEDDEIVTLFSEEEVQLATKDTPLIVLDDDEDEITEELKLIQSVAEMTKRHIEYVMKKNMSHFLAIFKGKQPCDRHDDYKAGGRLRSSLLHRAPVTPYTEQQLHVMADMLRHVFCRRHSKYFDYIMRVLLPEAMIMLHMDVFRTSSAESERAMLREVESP